MKKRLLAMALAASMMFSSLNVVYAQDADSATDVSVESQESAVAADQVESGTAVTVDPTPVEAKSDAIGINWPTTDPWKATVFGDCGGQDRIDNYGDTTRTDLFKVGPSGNVEMPYDVVENGKDVQVKMGIPNPSDVTAPYDSQGKISSTNDGLVYYYRQLTADDDFTISATAHVNGLANNNNQVSFGITVRDTVMPLDASNEAKQCGDSVSAGILNMVKVDTAGMSYAFSRKSGTLTALASAQTVTPMPGQDIPVKIKKAGTNYTVTFGNETSTIDGSELSMTDDLYAGFYASRCADITFKDVKCSVSGEPIVVGPLTLGGNGLLGNEDSMKYNLLDVKSDTDFDLTLDTAAKGAALGKLANNEDSYAYYSTVIPRDEDFVLKGTMNLALGLSYDVAKQGGAGIMLSDGNFTDKNGKNFTNPYANADGQKQTNSFSVGAMSTDGAIANISTRIQKASGLMAGSQTISTLIPNIGSNAQAYSTPFEYTIRKSGDNVKVTVNGVTSTTNIAGLFQSDEIHLGYFVARDGYTHVTNHNLVVGSRKAKKIEINTMPTKTSYYSTQPFDGTGLSVKATYADGTTDIIDDLEELSLTGFDDTTGGINRFITAGERDLTVALGSATTTCKINVAPIKITDVKLQYAPVRKDFVVGTPFDVNGMVAVATLEDGSTKTLTSKTYQLLLNDKPIATGDKLTTDMVGNGAVKVMYTNTDPNFDPNGVFASYDVTVKNANLTEIYIKTMPNKTSYIVGQEFDPSGLIINGKFVLDDGSFVYQNIDESEYTMTGFDSSVTNTNEEITVTMNNNPALTVKFSIVISTLKIVEASIASFPRLTYQVGEAFDPSGLVVNVLYNTGRAIVIGQTDDYVMFDGTKYFNVAGEEIPAEEAAKADYYIDLSKFDNTAVGSGKVDIVVNALGVSQTLELVSTTIDKTDYTWKATFMGASSLGVNDSSPSSTITYTDANGNATVSDKESRGIDQNITMTGGKLDNFSSVQLSSWDGAGKISGDQDGIAYFYTLMPASENFKLSADITVNRYILDPSNAADDAKIRAKMAEVGLDNTPENYLKALDMCRTGQEAFGIMARDVMPFAGGLDAAGNYTGGLNNHMTTDASAAMKDEHGNPVDLYEALMKKMTVTDSSNTTYEVSKANVENTFASNVVIAGGCTDSTYPTDPNSSSYYKKSEMNRINLMIRKGVIATDGGGERVGIEDTTTTVPKQGDKYTVTLQKINEGYMITTVNHQTGETTTAYDSLYDLVINNLLDVQDNKYMAVGMFASRWADATFENISLYPIDPATDKVTIPVKTTQYSPKISVGSLLYSTSTAYQLAIKPNNPHGGTADISLNGQVIKQDMSLGKKTTIINTTLVPDSVNEFTIVYKPSTADDCVSYDPVVTRVNVTQKSLNGVKELFVGPNGSVSAAGTREDPLDLETAIGFASFGSKIIMLDGTYYIKNTEKGKISISEMYSGKQGGRKTLIADEGAHPVLDLQGKYAGFEIAASYWTVEGITVTNSAANSKPFALGGNYDLVKNCTFHDNGDTGFQVSRLINSQLNIDDWPSNNLIENCESFNNCDPSKNNADGFGSKLTVGYNNVFEGCVSHHNLDDGWDCYTKLSTGAIGPVTLENCVSYRQGYHLLDGGREEDWDATSGGNGFKMGGENIQVKHYLKDCIAFENKANGVDSNNNPGFKLRNVVTYDNHGDNISLYSGTGKVLKDAEGKMKDPTGKSYKYDYDLKGIVSAGSKSGNTNPDSIGGLNYEGKEYANVNATPIESEFNYITYTKNTQGKRLVETTDVEGNVTKDYESLDPATFFKSVDSTTVLGDNQRYTRDADGKFIFGDFLARAVAYVHDPADEVKLPDVDETTTETTTQATTATQSTTEATTTTTQTTTKSSGGGGSSHKATINTDNTLVATTKVTEATTEATSVSADKTTEATTAAVKVNPPKAGTKVTYTDVPATHWANSAIEALASAGIVSGGTATTYGPSKDATRADFAVMLAKALGLEATKTASFSDVKADATYAKALSAAKEYGIINGYPDGTFKPENNVTRQDMMVMVANALKAMGVKADTTTVKLDSFSDATTVAPYARTSVATLVNAGIVSGNNGAIQPVKNITRAEMAILVKGLYDEAVKIAE